LISSTLSTQKRHTFLRRKYCFLVVAIALSPPVGRCDAAMGRPPFCSGMMNLLYAFSAAGAAGVAGVAGAPGAPGTGAGASAGNSGPAIAGAGVGAGGLRAARFSRAFLR